MKIVSTAACNVLRLFVVTSSLMGFRSMLCAFYVLLANRLSLCGVRKRMVVLRMNYLSALLILVILGVLENNFGCCYVRVDWVDLLLLVPWTAMVRLLADLVIR